MLVDRLWLRGISKVELHLDEWLKNFAASNKLCRWFDYDPEKLEKFREKYRNELSDNQELVDKVLKIASEQPVILVHASNDRDYNDEVVLKEYLKMSSE